MATTRRVTGTHWEDDVLRIQTDQGDIPWQNHIDWDVEEDIAPEFLVKPPCLFEPRCLVSERPCDCPLGAKPHVVYAAFYGTLPKVGLTSARRFAARLREQGADAGFMVARCPDRGAARRLEKDIAFLHRIPEWRTHKEKFPQLARDIPWKRLEARAEEWKRKLSIHGTPGELIRFKHPVPVLPARPHLAQVVGHHRGDVLGAKGPYLFYRPDQGEGRLDVGKAPVLALKHTELTGRIVHVD